MHRLVLVATTLPAIHCPHLGLVDCKAAACFSRGCPFAYTKVHGHPQLDNLRLLRSLECKLVLLRSRQQCCVEHCDDRSRQFSPMTFVGVSKEKDP
ncbi:hypothetical protein PRIC2_005984 [Phytophthora ramorum]